jgi:hypothetical protein
MFFLVPRIALILFVCFGVALAWRLVRQRRPQRRSKGPGRWSGRWGGRPQRTSFANLPLVPAEVLRGADRTWVVFMTPGSKRGRAIATRLRATEPESQVTEIDARREPLLVEAFRVHQLPALLLANRYGQVEARLIGQEAIDPALARGQPG